MFRQFETILTALCIVLSAVFLTIIILRIRNIYFKKNVRAPIWSKKVGILNRVGKITMAASLFLMAPGVIYLIFIVTIPSAVIRVYAKTLFCIIFSAWILLEIFLCYSISEKLLKGFNFRRIVFFFTVIFCIAIAVYLFPLIPKSLPYPAESDCVILKLPVRGTWLAGQAGASEITNGHLTNRYAIDILKLGQDGRLYKGREEAVTDFYSYNEPIYAPADGQVTQIVDSIQSDLMGNMDRDNPGGNYIILDIGNEKYVYYGHLKKGSIAVEEGQFVKAGTLVGHIGNSGYSTHPHLHMHIQNKPTSNPDGRITYAFRFLKMQRKRLMFWKEVSDGYLLRNDKFSD
ncbi:M23 family metallopeptidase [Candidatus Neomarinimicrobiota bacterium]